MTVKSAKRWKESIPPQNNLCVLNLPFPEGPEENRISTEMSVNIQQFLQHMPKVELHCHLEGAIPLDALFTLIQKYDPGNLIQNHKQLEKKFQYRNFDLFINTWVWKNQFLREYEDFQFIAEAVAKDLSSQHIRYAELYYSPGDFTEHHLELAGITTAIRKGLDCHKDTINILLIADLVRDRGIKNGARWLSELNEVREAGVVGIGLGGSEKEFPAKPYASIYASARKLGFQTTAHAGEADDCQSVWSAIRDLKVERIGHGTRSIEDPVLMEYLYESQIPLEMCPISNLRTGVVKQFSDHPVKYFIDNGLMVTINTDDPMMFNTSLAGEFETLMNAFSYSLSHIQKLMRNAIISAWCSPLQKQILQEEVNCYFNTVLKNGLNVT